MQVNPQQPPEAPASLVNIDAESAVIAAMLGDPLLVDLIIDRLGPEDFSSQIHARLFDAAVRHVLAGSKSPIVSIINEFRGDEEFQRAGGGAWLVDWSSGVLAFGWREFTEVVADLAARRRLISGLHATIDAVSAPEHDRPLASIVDQADAALVAAVEKRDTLNQPSASECLDEVLERIEKIKKSGGDVGIKTGIADLDDLTGGFEPGQLIIMGGRPGMGKTAIACSAVLGAARGGAGVLFVSLEMKAMELGMRMASDLCFDGRHGIPFGKIVDATVTSEEMREISRARTMIKDWPLRIIDAGAVTLSRLALGIRRHKRRMAAQGQNLGLVVIDYLQLLQPDVRARSNYEAVSEISRTLKALAKDNDLTILALAQLNRGTESREDKRPMLSDLRDSGQIEQDADAVIFLHREEYYLAHREPKNDGARAEHERALNQVRGQLELICAKRRNGRTGRKTARYYPAFQAVRSSNPQGGDSML